MKRTLILVLLATLATFPSVAQASSADSAREIIANIEYLLTPKDDKLIGDEDRKLMNQCWRVSALFQVCWVPRAELIARKAYWSKWLADHSIPWGIHSSEDDEFLIAFDNSVCEYRQTNSGNGSGPAEQWVWRGWVSPDKGPKVYDDVVTKFPSEKFVQETPTESSLCVIITYIRDGRLWLKHFYVPSRVEVQTLLANVRKSTVTCDNWPLKDSRFAEPEWMRAKLKYDREALWPSTNLGK